MVIREEARNMVRVSLTLDPQDVELLDALARVESSNRSHVVRSLLAEVRPMLRETVAAFERAHASREGLGEAAARRALAELQALAQEAGKIGDRALQSMRSVVSDEPANPRPVIRGSATPSPHLSPVPKGAPKSGDDDR